VKVVDGNVYINGKLLNEPYAVHDPLRPSILSTILSRPSAAQMISPNVIPEWRPEIRKYVQGDEIVVPPGKYSPWATIAIIARTALLGIRGPRRHHGAPLFDLLVGRRHQR